MIDRRDFTDAHASEEHHRRRFATPYIKANRPSATRRDPHRLRYWATETLEDRLQGHENRVAQDVRRLRREDPGQVAEMLSEKGEWK